MDTQPPGEHCSVPYTAVLYSSCPMTNSFYWSCFCLSPLANHKAILSSSFLVFGPNMEPSKYTNMYLNWIECNWNAKSRTWFWIQYRPTRVSFPSGSVVKKSAFRSNRCRRSVFHPWVGKIPWGRKSQPTLVFLPGKSHGQRSLVGYSLWGCKESDTTEHACTHHHNAGITCPFTPLSNFYCNSN